MTGLPSGLAISQAFVDAQLARRQAGYGRSPRQKLERDRAEVTAGIRHGRTLGGPVALTIPNRDHANWDAAMSVWPTERSQGNWRDRPTSLVRPGHADLGGMARGDFNELRPVLERASARETAARVAAGALAQALLAPLGIDVLGHVVRIGDVASGLTADPSVLDRAVLDRSEVRCADPHVAAAMTAEIDAAKADRDTLGGVVEVVVRGCPPGLGGYATTAERLDGRLAGAALSVQAMKAVEFGDGFALAALRGSAAHDEIEPANGDRDHGMGAFRRTNHAGGVEGGMTNGAPVVLRVAMKPLPTLMRPLGTVDLATGEATDAHAERSDTCAVPAAAVVLEAAIAFELARVVRESFGMQAFTDVQAAWQAYCTRVRFPIREAVSLAEAGEPTQHPSAP